MSTYAIIKTGGKQLLSELHLLPELLLSELLKNKVNKRKLLLSNINLKKAVTVNKVTVNHILRLSSTRSTLNFQENT